MTAARKPRIGISACLLGHPVRFNGGHKRDEWLVDVLGPAVEWVTFCPEMAMGLGAPRESMRLVLNGEGAVELRGNKDQHDFTAGAREAAARLVPNVAEVDGFVFKRNSPTCGLDRVKVYRPTGIPTPDGTGIFAAAVKEAYPDIPMIEEGRLTDPPQREHFVLRVFAYSRFRDLPPTIAALQQFHQAYKYVLYSHSPAKVPVLGRVAANSRKLPFAEVSAAYRKGFLDAIREPSTRGRHVNALTHMLGYLKSRIDGREKAQVLEVIEDYRAGQLPFIVPLTLLQHLIAKFDITYLRHQALLLPYPKGLDLRRL